MTHEQGLAIVRSVLDGAARPSSVYVVTSTLTVNGGVTLTIPQGVTVELYPATGMTVNGTLLRWPATAPNMNQTVVVVPN